MAAGRHDELARVHWVVLLMVVEVQVVELVVRVVLEFCSQLVVLAWLHHHQVMMVVRIGRQQVVLLLLVQLVT